MKTILLMILAFSFCALHAQDSSSTCKVEMTVLKGTYSGECKKGFANGKGEAQGLYRYTGNFKYGFPNGKGIMYYDGYFFDGNFQKGVREGKGEMHYPKDGKDSIVKGFWSGDEYRGKSYKTYQTDANSKFDRVDISPSSEIGDRLTIEISTTSSDFSGGNGIPRPSIFLTELISVKLNTKMTLINATESGIKYSWTFQLTEFPVTLRGVLSNGQDFNLELYKAADWTFKIYLNK